MVLEIWSPRGASAGLHSAHLYLVGSKCLQQPFVIVARFKTLSQHTGVRLYDSVRVGSGSSGGE